MEEKKVGKRLAVDAKAKKKKVALIVAGVAVAALLGGYTGLCAYASRDVLWPNSSVMGVDVSGLDYAAAAEKLTQALPEKLAGRTVTLRESRSGVSLTLSCDGLVEADGAGIVAGLNNRGGFFTNGGRFLAALTTTATEGSPALSYTEQGVERLEETLDELTHQLGIDGNETTWKVTEDALVLKKGVTGRAVDQTGLRQDVLFALSGTGAETVEVSIIEAAPEALDFEALREEIYREKAEAYLDRETLEIVPAVVGRDFDVAEAERVLADAAEGQTCRVALTLTRPDVTTESLTEALFRDELGAAVTRVTGTSDRRMNVGVAADFLNGKVVFPGEEFSFNQACSPYTVDNGYGKATAYVNGLSKDTVAGGICQASSTLYWASLKAGLETLERTAHRYEPSYVKGGLDATVYGDYGESGSLDFRFKNTTEHPIKIESYMDEKNYLHVTILGTDTTGIHGEPYSTNRVVTQEAQTIYEPKDSVPLGTTQKDPERTAYNAVTIETYQKLVDKDGNTVSETKLYTTKYKVRNAVVFYNPADLALWGIDPYTGLQTATPAPETTPPAEGEVTTPPAESGEVTPPPAETAQPTESAEPVGSTKPTDEVLTPPPAQTPTPAPTSEPEEALLPPGI